MSIKRLSVHLDLDLPDFTQTATLNAVLAALKEHFTAVEVVSEQRRLSCACCGAGSMTVAVKCQLDWFIRVGGDCMYCGWNPKRNAGPHSRDCYSQCCTSAEALATNIR